MLIDDVAGLPAGLLARCRVMPAPRTVLMCQPDCFDVIDVKNPHMTGNVGRVDRAAARGQWEALAAAFGQAGMAVEVMPPVAGCEDMVFCANQTFVGLDGGGRRVAIASRMRHESRRREVAGVVEWLVRRGYVVHAAPTVAFEGGGDAIWHPGRGLVWGGVGQRSAAGAYEAVAGHFDVPVLRLPLTSDRFYHLDTCLCALDEHTALVAVDSIAPSGVALLRVVFARVIECPADEAGDGLACNCVALPGQRVVLPMGNPRTRALLADAGFEVFEVDTGEFAKSGGSAYCMKQFLF